MTINEAHEILGKGLVASGQDAYCDAIRVAFFAIAAFESIFDSIDKEKQAYDHKFQDERCLGIIEGLTESEKIIKSKLIEVESMSELLKDIAQSGGMH